MNSVVTQRFIKCHNKLSDKYHRPPAEINRECCQSGIEVSTLAKLSTTAISPAKATIEALNPYTAR